MLNQNQTDIQGFEFRDVLPAILPSLRMLRERPPPRSHGQRLGRLWTYQAAAFRSGPSYARQVEQLVVVSGDDRRTGAQSACVGPAPTGASLFGVMSDHKGRGLVYVGSDPIPPGAVVLEYTGTRYGSRDTPPNTAYLFSLEDGGTIDGACSGGLARLVNHAFYSGRSFSHCPYLLRFHVSCFCRASQPAGPPCSFDRRAESANLISRQRRDPDGVIRVWLMASRPIESNEELLYYYGDAYDGQLRRTLGMGGRT